MGTEERTVWNQGGVPTCTIVALSKLTAEMMLDFEYAGVEEYSFSNAPNGFLFEEMLLRWVIS